MRHNQTSRGLLTSTKAVLAVVGLGLAGACTDSVSAPTSEVSVKVPAAYSQVLGVSKFRVRSREATTQRLDANHVLVIPAGGICDPATSGYGPAFWDAPCTPLAHSIVITATTYADAEGHPYIDFQPHLRFVPTKETNLYLKDGQRNHATMLTINWCDDANGKCVDESLTDASLVTHRVGHSRILVRRIKHFSGYHISAGDECNGTITEDPDGGLLCETADRGADRSGYMLASGLGKSGRDSSSTYGRRTKLAEK